MRLFGDATIQFPVANHWRSATDPFRCWGVPPLASFPASLGNMTATRFFPSCVITALGRLDATGAQMKISPMAALWDWRPLYSLWPVQRPAAAQDKAAAEARKP
jgi:hypothetical protein